MASISFLIVVCWLISWKAVYSPWRPQAAIPARDKLPPVRRLLPAILHAASHRTSEYPRIPAVSNCSLFTPGISSAAYGLPGDCRPLQHATYNNLLQRPLGPETRQPSIGLSKRICHLMVDPAGALLHSSVRPLSNQTENNQFCFWKELLATSTFYD